MTETNPTDHQPTDDPAELIAALHTAAADVVDNRGTPGAANRMVTLAATLDSITANDPRTAVVVAAALWLDRYGTAGAPERLSDLQDAVDALNTPIIGTTLEDAIESGQYTGTPQSVSDLFEDAEPEIDYRH